MFILRFYQYIIKLFLRFFYDPESHFATERSASSTAPVAALFCVTNAWTIYILVKVLILGNFRDEWDKAWMFSIGFVIAVTFYLGVFYKGRYKNIPFLEDDMKKRKRERLFLLLYMVLSVLLLVGIAFLAGRLNPHPRPPRFN